MKIVFAGIAQTPFENKFKIHYSVFKTFGAATGFSELGHDVYLVSKNTRETKDGVKFLPYKDMDKDFFKDVDWIIFGQERGVEKVVEKLPALQEIIKRKLQNKPTRTKIAVKTGRTGWMKDSAWGYKGGYKVFDLIFCQEPGFAQAGRKELFGDPEKKIYHSKMGVFSSVPKISNPSPLEKDCYNLLYMGRMRHNPSRMPFMINMMKRLGGKYHLNILPGTFSKPPELLESLNKKGQNKFGPESEENYQWLVEYFSSAKNITVHRVVPWGEHWNYLHHSDVGIDFASNQRAKKSIAGNAKLLEYMAAGLPSITESSVGNSELIKKGFGVVLRNSAILDEYCEAVRLVCSRKYDRNRISKVTIEENNWTVRAINMLKIMENVK